jgi:hypothetical protein
MVKSLKANCNLIFNKCLGVAPFDVIHAELKAENYVAAWQKLKDYHTQNGYCNSNEITAALQNAVFTDDERVEQWVEKMKTMFKNIASVSYLQDMMETYPNDKTKWRLDDTCMEFNSWDKTDTEIRAAGYATYLMHAARLNHLLTSLNKNPSNKFQVVINKFTLDDSKTIKTLYNLLIKWNSEKESQEYNNKSTINTITTTNNSNKNKNNKNNKNTSKEAKICVNHPNSTSHTTKECRQNNKDDKSTNNNKKRKNNNNLNQNDKNKKSSTDRHCENCAKNFPEIAHTHDTSYCRKPGGAQNNNKNNSDKISANNKSAMLTPDISNAISTSINSAVTELKGYLNKLSKGEDV